MIHLSTNTLLPFQPLRHFYDFMADPISFLQLRMRVGPRIQRLRFGPKHFVLIFDPDLAHEILVKRTEVFIQNRTIFDRIKPVTGDRGLVQLKGKESQAARAQIRSYFSPEIMDQTRNTIERYVHELHLGHESQTDIADTMTHLILRTALKIFLGIDSPTLVAEIGCRFMRLNVLCGQRMRSLFPAPLFIPTSQNKEINRLQQEVRALIQSEIGFCQGAIPSAFRGSRDVMDHCLTFLFAGHETTASSLAFSFYLLAQNPNYQERIEESGMALAIYKESLRLFPPAYMLAREASASCELHGIQIEKGDQIIIGTHAIHRNSTYFAQPRLFQPERFLQKLSHQKAFLPFGAGPKSCIGEKIAYLEAEIVLKMLCKRYRFSTDIQKIKANAHITLHPASGQFLTVKDRHLC